MKAFALQGSYAKSTMESISAIKPISDRVSAKIEFCFQLRIKDIWQHTTQLSQQAPLILKQTEHTEEQLGQILSRLDTAMGLKFMLNENNKMVQCRPEMLKDRQGPGANSHL